MAQWNILLSILGNYTIKSLIPNSLAWFFRPDGFKRQSNGGAEWIDLCAEESCVGLKPLKRSKVCTWSPPLGNGLKFKLDGSSRGNPGEAGVGGVLRDCHGKVLGMFSECVGTQVSIMAELLAIHRAVLLCSVSNFFYEREVNFISDSKTTMSWINSDGLGSVMFVKLIQDIRGLLFSLRNARVIFNPRSSNSFIDSLAKQGSGQEGDVLIWDFL
ncbi:hypothetical protein Ddye_021035 [Dipteronia dyeriana]|uniref:RNase H type-1 domain-containing protein n=1 Tax=Dipteronia dyeriana TaxID=168575 RepID=A0AAD9WXL4_9ROSI|nr:hypothetical protein Ddye_021035 [Dipteronia dyeriana]